MATVIANITHPEYSNAYDDWVKWRRCYYGGAEFKAAYLSKFSIREDDEDFERRKQFSPIPRFAGAAIDEVKNSIFQRMFDIGRAGGSQTYDLAVKGKNGGVDNSGSSMNMFIGQYILPELLVMKKVGVFIDSPKFSGVTVAEQGNKRPYLYMYSAEEIRAWQYVNVDNQNYLSNLLLRDTKFAYDDETGLPIGNVERFRRLWLKDGRVNVQYYDYKQPNESSSQGTWEKSPIQVLDIDKIPFVVFELDKSLMDDVADYQIALLNMESSDVNYSLNSNFPFYTEQYDQRENPAHLKDGSNTKNEEQVKEIKIGTTRGRRRPKGLDKPEFIHPSPEPLLASMKKQAEIKDSIRNLIGLSLSSVKPVHASAESKSADQGTLESGLSGIGLELENGERRIAEIWAMFEGSNKAATVNYPRKYSLKTETERREETKHLKEIQGSVGSITFQKEVAKRIADNEVSQSVSSETMLKIHREVDDSPYITSDPEAITKDIENGLVSRITASNARGYNGDVEVPQAKKEHAEELAEIAKSQSTGLGAARGVNTPGVAAKGSKVEKKGKPKRGEGK